MKTSRPITKRVLTSISLENYLTEVDACLTSYQHLHKTLWTDKHQALRARFLKQLRLEAETLIVYPSPETVASEYVMSGVILEAKPGTVEAHRCWFRDKKYAFMGFQINGVIVRLDSLSRFEREPLLGR